MLSALLDVFRLRQYFNVITRTRELVDGVREDVGLINDARRALVTLPLERPVPVSGSEPPLFPPFAHISAAGLRHRRVAVVATGGSGALASLVGVGRALEE